MQDPFLRNSFWGTVLNYLSGHKLFIHKEEETGYAIPKKYLIIRDPIVEESEINDVIRVKSLADEEQIMESSNEPVNNDKESDSKSIIVDWDGFLTVAVYMGAAIYTPGVDQLIEKFNINQTQATIPLTMFVVGYGVGPIFLSPITENAAIGRTSTYIITLFIFFILQIPTSLSTNFAELCVLRFLAGFFSSPALATGGATVGDVITLPYLPTGIAAWATTAFMGPAFGPLIGAALVVRGGHDGYESWRWPFWFMAIISGTCFLILGWTLPETYGKALLYRKANRLRRITGNKNIVSEGHIENSNRTRRELVVKSFYRPLEITLLEPVVLSINIFTTLVYSIMYLWFEAFPIVFQEVHSFSLVELGLSYSSIIVGVVSGAVVYVPYMYQHFTKRVLRGDSITPEIFIPMAIFGSLLMPIGIFIFGWTSSPDIHWFPPLVGAAICAAGSFIIFQTLLNYMGSSFYSYLASVFASNTLFRSVIGGVFPLFGKPLYENLGSKKFPVGWGSSVLGFISLAMASIPVYFYFNGPKLRARSRYAS
ncbi:multidrug resistance protein 2 [Scheffersomyces amazonensis]|uniref:multidrug resistance protein 2 n=1 Tax=Scheffersomyces amazonensis TaxID=1078765 RepID=UPI00315D9621